MLINGWRTLDSKPCVSLEEALVDVREKVLDFNKRRPVHYVRLCAGLLPPTSDPIFVISPNLNEKLDDLPIDKKGLKNVTFMVAHYGLK
jgi:hypothetical protein